MLWNLPYLVLSAMLLTTSLETLSGPGLSTVLPNALPCYNQQDYPQLLYQPRAALVYSTLQQYPQLVLYFNPAQLFYSLHY